MSDEAGFYASATHVPPVVCQRCGGTGRTPGLTSVHGPYASREGAVEKAGRLLAERAEDVRVFHVLPDPAVDVT